MPRANAAGSERGVCRGVSACWSGLRLPPWMDRGGSGDVQDENQPGGRAGNWPRTAGLRAGAYQRQGGVLDSSDPSDGMHPRTGHKRDVAMAGRRRCHVTSMRPSARGWRGAAGGSERCCVIPLQSVRPRASVQQIGARHDTEQRARVPVDDWRPGDASLDHAIGELTDRFIGIPEETCAARKALRERFTALRVGA